MPVASTNAPPAVQTSARVCLDHLDPHPCHHPHQCVPDGCQGHAKGFLFVFCLFFVCFLFLFSHREGRQQATQPNPVGTRWTYPAQRLRVEPPTPYRHRRANASRRGGGSVTTTTTTSSSSIAQTRIMAPHHLPRTNASRR